MRYYNIWYDIYNTIWSYSNIIHIIYDDIILCNIWYHMYYTVYSTCVSSEIQFSWYIYDIIIYDMKFAIIILRGSFVHNNQKYSVLQAVIIYLLSFWKVLFQRSCVHRQIRRPWGSRTIVGAIAIQILHRKLLCEIYSMGLFFFSTYFGSIIILSIRWVSVPAIDQYDVLTFGHNTDAAILILSGLRNNCYFLNSSLTPPPQLTEG